MSTPNASPIPAAPRPPKDSYEAGVAAGWGMKNDRYAGLPGHDSYHAGWRRGRLLRLAGDIMQADFYHTPTVDLNTLTPNGKAASNGR